jgi:hypothetical protein
MNLKAADWKTMQGPLQQTLALAFSLR